MEDENKVKYIIKNTEENINKLLEKGYTSYYSEQTGELEGYKFTKNNILGADCSINFTYDKESDYFILDDLITIYGRKESNMLIADALLSLVFESILKQKTIEYSKELELEEAKNLETEINII